MQLAGIDIGTTGCKCTIYSSSGEFITEAYEEYSATLTQDEQIISPNIVWEGVQHVLKEAASKVQDIVAIGVTSFGEAAILLDEKGEPLMEAFLYTDKRGEEEAKELDIHFGSSYISSVTGLSASPMYSLGKLMWIKKHRSEIFNQCKHICLFEDFIVYKLSGVFQIDYSLASRTMGLNINTLNWEEKLWDYAGISIALLSKVVPIGTKAGKISPEVALELNINKDAIVVSGCHDQVAAAVGTGVTKPGMSVDGTGTVECMTTVFESASDVKVLHKGGYAIVPYINGNYITYSFCFAGGALLKWYRDEIATLEAKEAVSRGEKPYTVFNKKVEANKPSGLITLPYFLGAGTPYMDYSAKGAIIGLTARTTSAEIYQSLMEGVTYEMRLNLDLLKSVHIDSDEIRATGGGATSSIWLQIKADILDRPIVSLGEAQAGTLGCIMLAGIASGIYKSYEEAEKIFVKPLKTYYPRKELTEAYMNVYTSYQKVYTSLKQIG